MRQRRILKLIRDWLSMFLDFRKIRGLGNFPGYLHDWRTYARAGGKIRFSDSQPCLGDRIGATPFDPHYFFQAAWLSRKLAHEAPGNHTDVGSDIRMISVLSAFISLDFIDFRPLEVRLEGLKCSAGNITGLEKPSDSILSLSCLHVVEHVGLGRYGDPIDPLGSERALNELARVLAPGGRLYLSVPVGRERVCFNAHRVFDPHSVVRMLPHLQLLEFSLVDDNGEFQDRTPLDVAKVQEYGCGLFIFTKK